MPGAVHALSVHEPRLAVFSWYRPCLLVSTAAHPTPGGALKTILTNGVIRACYQANTSYNSDEGLPLVNTFVSPPTGAAISFFQDIVDALNANYSSNVTIQWTLLSTTNQCFDVRCLSFKLPSSRYRYRYLFAPSGLSPRRLRDWYRRHAMTE